MFQRNESDTKEPGIVKHSINTLMFRSLKRTHDLFVASQSLSIPTHEQSSRLRKACKINSEYSAVKHMSAPNETAARVSSKTESGPVLGPYNQSDIEANIPSDDPGNRDAYRGSTALVSARDNNPLKSALALKAITTEKPIWHAPWKLYRVVSGHLGWVRCIDVDPSNDWFVTGSTDRTIKIWDLATSTLRLSLTGHISTIRAVKVSHRHTYLFSAGEDKQIKCWDLEQNKTIRHYHGHLSAVYGLALHPRLDVLISCGRDSTARVWDIRTKASIFTLSGHTNTVACVESQAPNPQVVTGSHDSTVRLWDLTAGKTRAILTNHKKSIRALALHPEEFTFTSASPDVIKQWRFPDGNFMQNLTGQIGIINCMAVNPDGVLVSGGDNGSLFFWDWRTGYNFQKAQTIVQPGSLDSEAGLFCMAFDKSGTRLLVGEADKTIKVYKQDESADEESHPVVWKSEILKGKKY